MTKKIKICHISDTHGRPPKPNRNADIVVLSGDICNTSGANMTPMLKLGNQEQVADWHDFYNYRKIDVDAEARDQYEWLSGNGQMGLRLRGINNKNVIFLNGNHDFLDADSLFPNYLRKGSKAVELRGIKFGLMTGVHQVNPHPEWNDEVDEIELGIRLSLLPRDIDVLITHIPCLNILDKAYKGQHVGSQKIYDAIFGRHDEEGNPYFYKLKAHLFGHAHDSRGTEKHEIDGRDIFFSNAACGRHDLELEI